jgi:hypothetical protein
MKEVIQAEKLFFGCMPCFQKNAAADSTFGWAVYGPERPSGVQPRLEEPGFVEGMTAAL